MKMTYDKEAEAAYIYTGFTERPVVKTVRITDSVLVDIGKWHLPVGIEILNFKPKKALSRLVINSRFCHLL